MNLKDESLEEFEELAQPLMKWLVDNGNPHHTIVISGHYAKVTSDELGIVATKPEEK